MIENHCMYVRNILLVPEDKLPTFKTSTKHLEHHKVLSLLNFWDSSQITAVLRSPDVQLKTTPVSLTFEANGHFGEKHIQVSVMDNANESFTPGEINRTSVVETFQIDWKCCNWGQWLFNLTSRLKLYLLMEKWLNRNKID